MIPNKLEVLFVGGPGTVLMISRRRLRVKSMLGRGQRSMNRNRSFNRTSVCLRKSTHFWRGSFSLKRLTLVWFSSHVLTRPIATKLTRPDRRKRHGMRRRRRPQDGRHCSTNDCLSIWPRRIKTLSQMCRKLSKNIGCPSC